MSKSTCAKTLATLGKTEHICCSGCEETCLHLPVQELKPSWVKQNTVIVQVYGNMPVSTCTRIHATQGRVKENTVIILVYGNMNLFTCARTQANRGKREHIYSPGVQKQACIYLFKPPCHLGKKENCHCLKEDRY